MKKLPAYKSAMVIGLGNVGRTVARFLIYKKIFVYVYDDDKNIYTKPENKFLLNNRLCRIMTEIKLPIQKPTIAITSPGISNTAQIIKDIRKNRIPLIDEIEFTASLVKSPIIAITGTNGKSTAAVLSGKIFAEAGQNVFWGGNLAPGLAFANILFQEPKDKYVIEVSSFQLQRCYNFHPDIAVITNITADHLDRHTTLSEYQKAKFRIFRAQHKNDYAIINFDDTVTMHNKKYIPSNIVFFSKNRRVNGAYIDKNIIYYCGSKILSLDEIKLFGNHYLDSILAAITTAKILNIDNTVIKKVLNQFTGLAHRLELIREYKGIKYINNSMCTNPSAAAATLQAFRQPVILIAGGKEKKLDVTEYVQAMKNKTKYIVLFGDNSKHLSHELKKNAVANFLEVSTLTQAVHTAIQKSKKNDIILFSPGFSSFDKFKNFQVRGKTFAEIVYAID